MSKFFVVDLEVQNHKYYGSLATPHDDRNYIVAAGWCHDGGDIKHEYFNTKEESLKSQWFVDGIKDTQFIVCHNATFELHWFMKNHWEELLAFINRGGQFFCTQLAEFLLTHQQDMYPKLEDCAVKYRGNLEEQDVRKLDEVKILWEQGVLTADIDKELLLSYLTDPVHGDIANTRRVCFNQVKQLIDNDMWRMFMMRMDSLVHNAFCTYFGLYVDMDIAEKNLAIQMDQIAGLNKTIAEQLPDDLPPEFVFKSTSGYHLSALLFGGTVSYDKKVSYEPKKFEKMDVYMCPDGSYYPANTHPDSLGSDIIRYKSGKNKGQPKVFSIDSNVEKLKWGTGAYTFKGLIDLESLPDVVKDQYLGKRAEFRGKQTQTCGTPVYSTSGDSLAVLAKYTDIAKPLNDLAALVKDTGTYYRMEKNGKVNGMLQFVEPDGIIHHQLNSCATVTARLSSSSPNMHNVPRDGTSRVKEMFSSRFGTDGRIVEVDYSALEVVTLASISGDENLMQMLLDGTDMHCYRLAAKLKESYESVFDKCHNKDHPDHKMYKQMRTDIKPRAFAHQYGASAAGIAYSTGCTLDDAEEFKRIEFELFPESNAYPTATVRPMVEATGLAAQPHREFIDGSGWSLYRRGHFKAKSGTCYSFRQFEKRVDGQVIQDYKDTQIANYWCQGEASLIVQAACGRIMRWLVQNNFFGMQVLLINTVHDASYQDCATEELAIMAGKEVARIMADTPAWMCTKIPALKDWAYDVTPFPAASEYGVNMMNKVSID